MKEWIKIVVGIYGEVVGLLLILMVSMWDLLIQGARGFYEYSICFKGVAVIWVGLALIIASKHIVRKK